MPNLNFPKGRSSKTCLNWQGCLPRRGRNTLLHCSSVKLIQGIGLTANLLPYQAAFPEVSPRMVPSAFNHSNRPELDSKLGYASFMTCVDDLSHILQGRAAYVMFPLHLF